ncbi:MAG: hypothetical protein QOE26_2561, partial [Verrucomicrobiota bacterium]
IAAESKIRVIAVEAGQTLLIEKAVLIEAANRLNVTIVGLHV